jgi:uncharacterized protein YndB with AHSA1/START domain
MIPKTEITHSFNAPPELVFKAFTESEHLQNWWDPKGWAFDISKFELRKDGVFHSSQTSPDVYVMWVKFIYHEINAPDKLVYTSFFSDEMGNIVCAPFNYEESQEMVQEGFSGTFVQLADYLSTISYD